MSNENPEPSVDAILIPVSLVSGSSLGARLKSVSGLLAGFRAPTTWHVAKLPGDDGYFARLDPSETFYVPGGAMAGKTRHAWRDAPGSAGIKLGTLIDLPETDDE